MPLTLYFLLFITETSENRRERPTVRFITFSHRCETWRAGELAFSVFSVWEILTCHMSRRMREGLTYYFSGGMYPALSEMYECIGSYTRENAS